MKPARRSAERLQQRRLLNGALAKPDPKSGVEGQASRDSALGTAARCLARAGWALALLTAGCSGGPREPAPEPHTAANLKAAPSAEAAETEPKPSVNDPFAGTLQEVAAARGLAIRAPVRGLRVTRAEMLDEVEGEIEREVPAHALEATREILVSLGLAPIDFDYATSIRRVMTAKLAGFYQPRTKTMYLAQDLPAMEQIITLNHELVHALQDQHFGLGDRLRYREDAGDEQAALHALAEGDATSLMLDLMVRPQGKNALDIQGDILEGSESLPPEAGEVPGVIVRSIIAPYRDGLEFVHWLRRRGGWAAVTAAWARPPVSTEQVIHPEKYQRGEAPLVVEVPAPPGAGWRATYHDVMGEQGLRAVLEEWRSPAAAAQAASGWGGDRVAVYSLDDQRAVAWRMRSDDDASARRLVSALDQGFFKAKPPSAPSGLGGVATKRCQARALGALALASKGRDVVVVVGAHPVAGTTGKSAGCPSAQRWAARIVGN